TGQFDPEIYILTAGNNPCLYSQNPPSFWLYANDTTGDDTDESLLRFSTDATDDFWIFVQGQSSSGAGSFTYDISLTSEPCDPVTTYTVNTGAVTGSIDGTSYYKIYELFFQKNVTYQLEITSVDPALDPVVWIAPREGCYGDLSGPPDVDTHPIV